MYQKKKIKLDGIAWDEALWIAAETLCPSALINHLANGQPYQMYGINTLAAGIGVGGFSRFGHELVLQAGR